MNLNLHIERLVVDGLDGAALDSDAIGAAVQRELARLLGDGAPSLAQGFSVHRARAEPLTLNANAGANPIGRGIARSVYGELNSGANNRDAGEQS